MAQIPDRIIEIIKNFVIEAKVDNVSIEKAILFGSYAKGTNHKFSDIDVAVVSKDFEGTRFYDNEKLSRSKIDTSIDLETHPYRPEDFTEDNPFVKEILETGIRII
ncbi:MAG: nucleotidyltransferase domain-containing protein [Candidatus Kapabacteria bacterium]|nr:nucleotidyltransferase domain-containing protein [Candidatus Kapabacteria bacterium]